MRIIKGDTVKVIAGKDRGKTGTVTRALPATQQVIVDGVNLRTRHQRSRGKNQQGQTVEIAAPIHVSNIALVDPQTGEPTRVGIDHSGDTRVRIAKKSGTKLDT